MRDVMIVQEDENVLISKSALQHKPSVGRYCWVASTRTTGYTFGMLAFLAAAMIVGPRHNDQFPVFLPPSALGIIAGSAALMSILLHAYNTGNTKSSLEFYPNQSPRVSWNTTAAALDFGQQSFFLAAIWTMTVAVFYMNNVEAITTLAIVSVGLATVSAGFRFFTAAQRRHYRFLPGPHKRARGSDYDLDNSEQEDDLQGVPLERMTVDEVGII